MIMKIAMKIAWLCPKKSSWTHPTQKLVLYKGHEGWSSGTPLPIHICKHAHMAVTDSHTKIRSALPKMFNFVEV